MKINHILVVCIGNICRSPMAEYFLKQQYPHLQIESAGIAGVVGHADNEKAMEQCMEKAQEEQLTERPITISKKMERQLNKKQKIVTESGIEIIVPIEFLQNNDVFE